MNAHITETRTDLALTLDSDTFNALKNDFKAVLRKTLTNMDLKGADCAELTVKVKISTSKEHVPDFDAGYDDAQRDAIVPRFDHKVTSVMSIKDELSGTLGGHYELYYDAERGEYSLREIANGQTSMFESSHQDYNYQPTFLPAHECVLCDAPPEDNDEDADCRDICDPSDEPAEEVPSGDYQYDDPETV
jgi:hypothetical protein